jgi:glucoamylase
LRCLLAVQSNAAGIAVPAGIDDAVTWLRAAIGQHWNGEYYVSVLDSPNLRPGYDPNIDVVLSCVYGALDPTDPHLLATAGLLRQQWSDPASPTVYPINVDDQSRGLGPLLGRYPGDVYDGDDDNSGQDHPWALCTANFAEFYYRLAAAISSSGEVGHTAQTAQFFGQVGIDDTTTAAQAAQLLQAAGDRMLQALVFHSDHLELSEQFDGRTGYEKSVRNLTWSYAAYLSAIRARAASVPG